MVSTLQSRDAILALVAVLRFACVFRCMTTQAVLPVSVTCNMLDPHLSFVQSFLLNLDCLFVRYTLRILVIC
jgi:hypothetical protein